MNGVLPTRRIVLTGGPGGGKTTAADLFRREIGDHVVVVPESATLLFGGGFPRDEAPAARVAAQRAIFHVQRNLEDVQTTLYPQRVLLCDRGTVDGAAYWPGPPEDYFTQMGTTLAEELARYHAVLFFESAAVGGLSVEGGNPMRTEGLQQAVALDARLRAIWQQHPRFKLVPHHVSFMKKLTRGLEVLQQQVDALSPPLG